MAVLARLIGIPSRIAYGFTSGSSLGDNEWQVTTHDAHAWPELYFSGSGWLRFEPTPSGPTGQGTAYQPTYTDLASGTSAGTPAQSAPTTAAELVGRQQGEPDGARATSASSWATWPTPASPRAGARRPPRTAAERTHGRCSAWWWPGC